MLEVLPDLLLAALVLGSIYALFSVSLNMVWSMANVVNIGHGEILTLGAYGSLTVVNAGVFVPLGFVLLGVVTIVVSVVFYVILLWGLRERDLHYGSLLVTWGVSLSLFAALRLVFGTDFQSVRILRESVDLGIIRTTQAALVVLLSALLTSGGLALMIQRTPLGRSMRAIAADPDLASSVGINVPIVRTTAFVLGMLLAVVAGVLLSTLYVFYPLVGQLFIIKAVAIVLVAGLGRLWWTWAAGMGLGVVEVLVQFQISAQLSDLVAYTVLIIVLLFRRNDILRLVRSLPSIPRRPYGRA